MAMRPPQGQHPAGRGSTPLSSAGFLGGSYQVLNPLRSHGRRRGRGPDECFRLSIRLVKPVDLRTGGAVNLPNWSATASYAERMADGTKAMRRTERPSEFVL